MRKYAIFFALFLVGCTSMMPVPTSVLESHRLVGKWTSGQSWLNIYCSGAISYDIHPDTDYVLRELASRSSSGGHVAEVNDRQFIVGTLIPVFKETFEVTAWPHQEQERLVMTVDGRTWTQQSYERCQN